MKTLPEMNQRIAKLTDAQREEFYILLGRDAVEHFATIGFGTYPSSDFQLMVDNLIHLVTVGHMDLAKIVENKEGNEMEKANNAVEQIVSKMDDELNLLGVSIESLNHVRSVLGRLAVDANDKYIGEKQMYFLWDNNDILQMMDDLMFHQLGNINESYKQIDDMKEELRSLIEIDELDEKKTLSAATE